MDAKRRHKLNIIYEEIDELQGRLELLMIEERKEYESLSESERNTKKGVELDENASSIQNAIDSFDEVLAHLDDVLE